MVYVRMVSRDAWKAQPPLRTEPLIFPVKSVIFRYTDTEKCFTELECSKMLRGFQQAALAKGMADIPYNFLIGSDLSVYEGRGWNNKMHDRKLVIAYICYPSDIDENTEQMNHLAYQFIKMNDNKVNVLSSLEEQQGLKIRGEGFYGGDPIFSPPASP